jgi:hypothetical protein
MRLRVLKHPDAVQRQQSSVQGDPWTPSLARAGGIREAARDIMSTLDWNSSVNLSRTESRVSNEMRARL